MFDLKITRFIEAAHKLPDSESLLTKQCANLHGHTYHIIVRLNRAINARNGMVVDFKGIKNIIDTFDHRFINDEFQKLGFDIPSTAENLAQVIYDLIVETYSDLYIVSVSVCEGYKGEDNSSYVTYSKD